ncbi:MAG: hypothetical protein ACUVSK_11360, partial [Desulfotomaculales bacterium]
SYTSMLPPVAAGKECVKLNGKQRGQVVFRWMPLMMAYFRAQKGYWMQYRRKPPAETVCFYELLCRSQAVFLLLLLLASFMCAGCDPRREKSVLPKEPGLSAREAFAVAWPEAQRWDTDARLCRVWGGPLDGGG